MNPLPFNVHLPVEPGGTRFNWQMDIKWKRIHTACAYRKIMHNKRINNNITIINKVSP